MFCAGVEAGVHPEYCALALHTLHCDKELCSASNSLKMISISAVDTDESEDDAAGSSTGQMANWLMAVLVSSLICGRD
eukprot:scaffold2946_cov209-Alexandrium_tamarense.AAC.5